MGAFYQSEKWLTLPHNTRACIVPVIEGVKRGTEVWWGTRKHYTQLVDIIESAGLDFQAKPPSKIIRTAGGWIYVAKSSDLGEFLRRSVDYDIDQKVYCDTGDISGKAKIANARYDKVYHQHRGWLFDYPDCCIASFGVKEEQDAGLIKWSLPFTSRFYREMQNMVTAKRAYPEIFDYRPQGFVPCSLYCEPAKAKVSQ